MYYLFWFEIILRDDFGEIWQGKGRRPQIHQLLYLHNYLWLTTLIGSLKLVLEISLDKQMEQLFMIKEHNHADEPFVFYVLWYYLFLYRSYFIVYSMIVTTGIHCMERAEKE